MARKEKRKRKKGKGTTFLRATFAFFLFTFALPSQRLCAVEAPSSGLTADYFLGDSFQTHKGTFVDPTIALDGTGKAVVERLGGSLSPGGRGQGEGGGHKRPEATVCGQWHQAVPTGLGLAGMDHPVPRTEVLGYFRSVPPGRDVRITYCVPHHAAFVLRRHWHSRFVTCHWSSAAAIEADWPKG